MELNLFFQKQVHLALDRVFLAVTNEGSAEVERGHCVEILVRSTKAAHHAEISVEKVLAVTTVRNSIINDLL